MAKVYPTIEEEIRKRTFAVIIPEGYQFQVHPYYLEHNAPPLCEMPSNDMCKSRLPITHIVDMCFKKISFGFEDRTNILKIVQLIEVYLESIRSYRSLDRDLELFASRCELTLNQLRPVKERIANNAVKSGKEQFEPNRLGKLLEKLARNAGGHQI